MGLPKRQPVARARPPVSALSKGGTRLCPPRRRRVFEQGARLYRRGRGARRGLSRRRFVAWTRRRPPRIFRKEFFLSSLRIVQACFRQRAPLFSCGRSFALRAVFQEAPRPPESEFAAPLVGGANSLCGGPVEKGRGPQGPRHAGPERPLNFSTELRGVGVGRGPAGREENRGMKGAGRHRHEGGGGEMACGRRGGRRASRWTERASI